MTSLICHSETDSCLRMSAPPSSPSHRSLLRDADNEMPEKTRASYFSNVKTRLGSRLPAGTLPSGPWGPPRPTGHALTHPLEPRVQHHVPHIRNPQLRRYYLKESEWDSDSQTTAVATTGPAPDGTAKDEAQVEAQLSVASLALPPPEQKSQTADARASSTPVADMAGLPSPVLDADYDKLLDVEAVPMPDGQLCLLALPSECSRGEGSASMPYLKLCSRYITDRKGVASGVLLVTPNKIFFDPYKCHPLVLEHGWEEYLLSCSVDSLASISFYPDISHVHFSAASRRVKGRKKEAPMRMGRIAKKRQQGERHGTPSKPKGEALLAASPEPAPEEQSLGDEGVESRDMAEAEKQLGRTVDELAAQCTGMLGAAVFSGAATFCCGGLDAGDRGSAEQTPTQRLTRKATSETQASSSHGDLMFIRLRFHPVQRKKGNLGPSKIAPTKDAWFTLSQESSDELYAYLTHWRPDVCILEGGEEDEDEEDEEFVLVDDKVPELSQREGRPGEEWELVSVDEGGGGMPSLALDREPEGLRDILAQSRVLEEDHVRQIYSKLPPRTVGHTWRLAYSTSRHGASLRSLYRKLAGSDSPTLVLVKDTQSQVFGAFLSHPLRPSDAFYGTGETFLFTLHPHFKCFCWTGDNSFFIKGDLDSFAVGGGSGHFGLWLDESLDHGRSSPCDTFNNCCLSGTDDFRVLEIEVWTFC